MSAVSLPTREQRYRDTAQAFNSVARMYDGPLGNNTLVQQMRESVWRTVQHVSAPPAHLLDLGCGVGLDAVYFARQGYEVMAIDDSLEMVMQTRRHMAQQGVATRINTLHLGIQDLQDWSDLSTARYDVIYSNMGALNCLPDLSCVARAARACAHLLKPGGALVFAVMGRICPWELIYSVMHGNLRRASVRFASGQTPVSLNGHHVWTRYYTPNEFCRPFAPYFKLHSCRGLGLFVPPPYMQAFCERHPALWRVLSELDQHVAAAPVLRHMGDHFLVEMRRHAE
jgi:2-polyprenyl-3-methyl-5-hydroxy-6-metoxy-1,4-benzoquinol methylase